MVNPVLVPYKDEYEDELSNLLVEAYMHSNPFIKPLDLTRGTLLEEFRQQLRGRMFSLTLVYIDGDLQKEGKFQIVSIFCWNEVLDFLPTGDLANTKNFLVVPKKSQVRLYMRHLSMQPFFDKYKPVKGQWVYGSTFAIHPKYQKIRNLSTRIFYLSTYEAHKAGYTHGTGHAINEFAKAVFRRAEMAEIYEVDVSDIYAEDMKTKPFAGLNLSQEIYVSTTIIRSLNKLYNVYLKDEKDLMPPPPDQMPKL